MCFSKSSPLIAWHFPLTSELPLNNWVSQNFPKNISRTTWISQWLLPHTSVTGRTFFLSPSLLQSQLRLFLYGSSHAASHALFSPSLFSYYKAKNQSIKWEIHSLSGNLIIHKVYWQMQTQTLVALHMTYFQMTFHLEFDND